MDRDIAAVWQRVTACLGQYTSTLDFRPGAGDAEIDAVEAAIGARLPDDYRAWLRLHDGENDADDRVEWLPGGGRLLPVAVTLERWRDEQESLDDDGLDAFDDGDRIRCVIHHPGRIVIAGNAFGDGDNTYLDLIPAPAGSVGQIIVATSECDFEVVGSSFLDFLRRFATAFEDGALAVDASEDPPRVDFTGKQNPWERWEAVLRNVVPR